MYRAGSVCALSVLVSRRRCCTFTRPYRTYPPCIPFRARRPLRLVQQYFACIVPTVNRNHPRPQKLSCSSTLDDSCVHHCTVYKVQNLTLAGAYRSQPCGTYGRLAGQARLVGFPRLLSRHFREFYSRAVKQLTSFYNLNGSLILTESGSVPGTTGRGYAAGPIMQVSVVG
ncbi:uncharacterized protein C8Q71DRAFT_771416 [Rhodofomes roseus]|uniref:Uncharacterized protein n=1 Tax=Rhodofomes roseus TaxID=34475 RepID=A0ABQ8KB48_9APHY|nr:uncharacterized protein C8Q71DRAFT_771416 [Rhodofomes roseus]KAH9834155.1 hypothetical protein C8Q71DRAFT_771416 [Rhodofomes roseus]